LRDFHSKNEIKEIQDFLRELEESDFCDLQEDLFKMSRRLMDFEVYLIFLKSG
jgi:hypothetical protein